MNRYPKDSRRPPEWFLKWFGIALLIGLIGGMIAQVVKWFVG